MDFRAPGLLDQWLEPPEEVFSAGAFLELGPPCPHAEAPGTPEQGLPGNVSVTAQVGLGCPGPRRIWVWGQVALHNSLLL